MNENLTCLPGPRRGGTRIVDLLLVLAVSLWINCQLLGQGPLAGTEGHRALVAHRMLQDGQWLLPRLYDQVYLAKPPLDYWILAGVEKLTGRSDVFIWRLPSAVEAALTAAFLCLITGRWYGRLAGFVAGIASCSVLALWGQNHTAEIDALNTLACVVCACLLIDLAFGPPRRRAWVMAFAGIAWGAALLIKGPAGMTLIAGALLGPALFNRTRRPLADFRPWIAAAIGLAMFGGYALVAWVRFRALQLPPDTSGLREVVRNITTGRGTLRQTILLPLTMLLYMLPASLCLPLALHPAVWRSPPETRPGSAPWSEADRRLLRALVGTLAMACALTMLAGLVHPPRWSYVWVPLVCPVAGAVAAAWRRRIYPPSIDGVIDILMGTTAIAFAGIVLTFTILCQVFHAGHLALLWASVATAAGLAAIVIRLLAQRRVGWAGCTLIAIIALAGLPFGVQSVTDRKTRSSAAVSLLLSAHVPPGTTITTGHILLDFPEIFYYAGMQVESHPFTFDRPRNWPAGRWLLLNQREYAGWEKTSPSPLTAVWPVQIQFGRPDMAFLAWYAPRHGVAPSATTRR